MEAAHSSETSVRTYKKNSVITTPKIYCTTYVKTLHNFRSCHTDKQTNKQTLWNIALQEAKLGGAEET
jgi:hypothetical protein